jgi:hypothetical protein
MKILERSTPTWVEASGPDVIDSGRLLGTSGAGHPTRGCVPRNRILICSQLRSAASV